MRTSPHKYQPVMALLTLIIAVLTVSETHAQQFVMKTQDAGLIDAYNSNGISVADFDLDGDLDLYFVGYLPHEESDPTSWNRLYRNNGDGTFTDVAVEAGVRVDFLPKRDERMMGNKFGASWGDYDDDGDPDLFLTNVGPEVLFQNKGDGTFEDVSVQAGLQESFASGDSLETAGALWWDLDVDGDLDLYVYAWTGQNRLYENNGDGTFNNISDASGVDSWGRTWTVLPADVDRDFIPDLYLVNDFGPNELYKGLGNNTFEDVTDLYQVGDSGNGMGATIGDVNNDGLFDIFLTNISMRPGTPNPLYLGTQAPPFVEAATGLGIDRTDWSWGTEFFDADQDGDLDVYVVNGMALEGVTPNRFFSNTLAETGTFGFIDISESSNTNGSAEARGLVVFDGDGDGDLDMLVANWGDATYLYENQSITGNWLQIELEGVTSNKNGLGAVLRATTAEGTYFRMNDGMDFLGQSIQPVHFGLGSANVVRELRITWPNGYVESFFDVTANQVFRVQEGSGVAVAVEDQLPFTSSLQSAIYPNPVHHTANLTFRAPTSGKYSVSVYSALGELVSRLQISLIAGEEAQIELRPDNLPPGLYLYRIISQTSRARDSGSFVSLR